MRKEPKVGTKAPMKKGGTGGGMSKEAVKAASTPPAAKKAAPADPKLNQKREVRRNADMGKKYGI